MMKVRNVFCQLTDRGILAISGPDSLEFLQGCVTCNMHSLSDKSALYGLHLTPQGKFLFDFFIFKLGDKYLLDCHKDTLMELAKSLNNYKLNQQIEFEDLSDDLSVISGLANTEGHIESEISFIDPRTSKMGKRFYLNQSQQNKEKLSSTVLYERFRILQTIPNPAIDAIRSKTMPSDLGLEKLNAIDFDKGCYVGQEVTARLKHRSSSKKAFFKINYHGIPCATGTAIHGNVQTSEVGHLYSQNTVDGFVTGIAILKLRDIEKNSILFVNNQEILKYEKANWLD